MGLIRDGNGEETRIRDVVKEEYIYMKNREAKWSGCLGRYIEARFSYLCASEAENLKGSRHI